MLHRILAIFYVLVEIRSSQWMRIYFLSKSIEKIRYLCWSHVIMTSVASAYSMQSPSVTVPALTREDVLLKEGGK